MDFVLSILVSVRLFRIVWSRLFGLVWSSKVVLPSPPFCPGFPRRCSAHGTDDCSRGSTCSLSTTDRTGGDKGCTEENFGESTGAAFGFADLAGGGAPDSAFSAANSKAARCRRNLQMACGIRKGSFPIGKGLWSFCWNDKCRGNGTSSHQKAVDWGLGFGFRLVGWWTWWSTSPGPERWEAMALLCGRPSNLLSELDLPDHYQGGARPFDLGSLRPGGATHLLLLTESPDLVRRRGRWISNRVCEIYLQEVLYTTFIEQLRPTTKQKIHNYAAVFPKVLNVTLGFLSSAIPPVVWPMLFRAHNLKELG